VAGAERPDGARERGRGLSAGPAAIWGGADYDAIVPHFAPIYDGLVARLAPQAGERFLDVATGTGEIALRAARSGAEINALDIAPALLALAREKPGAEAIRFEEGDAQSLPYEDAAFDVVASNFGVIFAPNRDAAARELARVCRGGGRLGLTAWCPIPAFEELWLEIRGPAQVDPTIWAERAELERLLGDAFELELVVGTWWFEGESAEAMYEFSSRVAPPMKAFLDSADDETRARVRKALVTYWEGFRDGDRVREPRRYVLVLGRRR